jgi:hypothetical protein
LKVNQEIIKFIKHNLWDDYVINLTSLVDEIIKDS